MFSKQLSQTQLANIASFAGIAVILLQQFDVVLSTDQVTFVLAAIWTLGWNGYNYYQRWTRGDVNILGSRKV
jgi:hypothetical protein